MRRVSTCAGALLAVIVFTAASAAIASAPAPNRTELTRSYALPYRIAEAPASSVMELTMLALLNQSRGAAGLSPLKANTTLRTVARTHGSDMFAYGYLSHESREGRLPRLVERSDRKGDLHEHTEWSDGHHPLDRLV